MIKLNNLISLYTKFIYAVVIITFICACNITPDEGRYSLATSVDTPGVIYSSIPVSVDPDRHYLFYIHGAIIEDQGINAISPDFGPYEFAEILTYLADAGYYVIGDVRGPTPDPNQYSDKIAESIQYLKEQGVKSSNITVMGFSKGAGLTIRTSSKLGDPEISYILIAICAEWIDQDPTLKLSGRVLSVYEKSDPLGSSCQNLVDRSPDVSSFYEIEFNTGKKHGAFYTADSLWLDLVINWLNDLEN